MERAVHADRFGDQVDIADGAFDADAIGIARCGVGNLHAPALHQEAGRRRGIEAGRGAGGGQELWRAGGECYLGGVGKARPAGVDPAGGGDDQPRRRTEHFHRAVDLRGRLAGHLVDDQAGRPGRGEIAVGADLATEEGAAANRAVVQDEADRVHHEGPVLVQRNALRVGRRDAHDGDAALRCARPRGGGDRRCEAQGRARVRDRRRIGCRRTEAGRHRQVCNRPAQQALTDGGRVNRRSLQFDRAGCQHACCLLRLLQGDLHRPDPQGQRKQARDRACRHTAAPPIRHGGVGHAGVCRLRILRVALGLRVRSVAIHGES